MRFRAILLALFLIASGVRAQQPEGPPQEIAPGLTFSGLVRGFYGNDQRIEWSGVEDTFGAEAVLRGRFETENQGWRLAAQAELFLNVPNGRSILSDPQRDLYRANFEVPPLQVFQLFVEARYDDWSVRLGHFATPLGRYESPMLTNALNDAPFLRTEITGFAETGVLLSWRPGIWSFDVGVTNGEPDLDTNSSKAFISRIGAGTERWSAGIWIKAQDGIGSEQQKRFRSFVGFDAQAIFGPWTIYGEGLIDQHGLYRDLAADGNPLALVPRSLYGRDVFKAFRDPIYGGGFDAGVTWRRERLTVDLNYGLYFPEQIGRSFHDAPIHRGVAKVLFEVAPRLHVYAVGIVENKRPHEIPFFDRAPPFMVLGGLQYGF